MSNEKYTTPTLIYRPGCGWTKKEIEKKNEEMQRAKDMEWVPLSQFKMVRRKKSKSSSRDKTI